MIALSFSSGQELVLDRTHEHANTARVELTVATKAPACVCMLLVRVRTGLSIRVDS